MKLTTAVASLAGVLLASFVGTSQASVIDFQDVVSGNCNGVGNSIQSRGFTFAGNPQDANLFVCNPGVIQSNSSAALINANSRSILTMTESGGAAFSLMSFFAGGRTQDFNPAGPVTSYDVATSIDILGNLMGGGSVLTTIALDSNAPYDWSQFILPASFTNLSSVVFTAQGRGDRPEFLIDDIVVNDSNQRVPEPASVALLGLGLAGLAFSRRKSVTK